MNLKSQFCHLLFYLAIALLGAKAMQNAEEIENSDAQRQAHYKEELERIEREQRKYEYIGNYLRKNNKYVQPFSFGGTLVAHFDGQWLHSDDQLMKPLAEMVHLIMRDEFGDYYRQFRHSENVVVPNGGCNVQLKPNEWTFHHAFLFEQVTTKMADDVEKEIKKNPMEGEDLVKIAIENYKENFKRTKIEGKDENDEEKADNEGEGESEENKIKLAEFVLWEVMQRGEKAFGEKARMDLRGMPKYDPSKVKKVEKKWAETEALVLKRAVNWLKGTAYYKEVVIESQFEEEKRRVLREMGMDPLRVRQAEKRAKAAATSDAQEYFEELDISAPLLTKMHHSHSDIEMGILDEIEGEREMERRRIEQRIDPKKEENLMRKFVDFLVEILQKRINYLLKPEEEKLKPDQVDHRPHAWIIEDEGKVHPYEFLQRIQFQIEAEPVGKLRYSPEARRNCAKISEKFIKKALYESKSQFAKDLRARLGAQILFSVFNGKQWQMQLGAGMMASMVWTIGMGGFLDLFAWLKVTKHVKKGEARFWTDVALKSLSALIVETGDSSIIGRLTAVMRGGELVPTWNQFWDDFKDALLSGVVSMFGSIANNVAVKLKNTAFVGVQLLTTIKATASSAAMVPIQFDNIRSSLVFFYLLKVRDGFLPKLTDAELNAQLKRSWWLKTRWPQPDESFDDLERSDQNRLIIETIKNKMKLSVELEKTTGMMIRSMGVGSMISILLGFVPTYALEKRRIISEGIVNAWDLTIFQPTESYSLNYNYFAANYIGSEHIQRLLSTDVNKYKQTAKLIVQKGLAQYRNRDPETGEMGKFEPISDKEVRKIYHTWFGSLPFYMGKFITMLINWFVNLFLKRWKKMGQQIDHLPLAEIIENHKLIHLERDEVAKLHKKYQIFLDQIVSAIPQNANQADFCNVLNSVQNGDLREELEFDRERADDGYVHAIGATQKFYEEIEAAVPEYQIREGQAENSLAAQSKCIKNLFIYRASIGLFEQIVKKKYGVEILFIENTPKPAELRYDEELIKKAIRFVEPWKMQENLTKNLSEYQDFLIKHISKKIEIKITDGNINEQMARMSGQKFERELLEAYEYEYQNKPDPKNLTIKKLFGWFTWRREPAEKEKGDIEMGERNFETPPQQSPIGQQNVHSVRQRHSPNKANSPQHHENREQQELAGGKKDENEIVQLK